MTEQKTGHPSEGVPFEQTASALGNNLRNFYRHIGATHNQSPEGHLISKVPVRNDLQEALKKLYPHITTTQDSHIRVSSGLSVNSEEESYDVLFMYGKNNVMFYFWYNPALPGNSRGYFKAHSELGGKIQGFTEERRMTPERTLALNEFLDALSPSLGDLTPSDF